MQYALWVVSKNEWLLTGAVGWETAAVSNKDAWSSEALQSSVFSLKTRTFFSKTFSQSNVSTWNIFHVELETLNDKGGKNKKKLQGWLKDQRVFHRTQDKPSDNLQVMRKFHKLSFGNESAAACFIIPANPWAKMSVGAADYEPWQHLTPLAYSPERFNRSPSPVSPHINSQTRPPTHTPRQRSASHPGIQSRCFTARDHELITIPRSQTSWASTSLK